MDIGQAVKALQKGDRVRRAGWNGKGMWLAFVKEWVPVFAFEGEPPEQTFLDDAQGYLPFVAMFTADKMLVPWLCSQTDLLAIDWEIAD
jgi:hypothetical protein